MTGLIDIDIIMSAQSGNDDAKVAICKAMIQVIRKKAWYIPPEWKDDAMQSGYLGVLRAIDKYDPTRTKGVTEDGEAVEIKNFECLASWYIKNEISNLFDTCIGICDIPRRIMQMYFDAKRKNSATLANGMKVDDIDKLMSYGQLKESPFNG